MFEQAFTKFVFDFLILAAGLAGGALALWTWQKRYWEYQLRRQTEDWKARQSYSRKDARRQAMEGLLTELNEAMERHLIATYHALSALARSTRYRREYPDDDAGQEQWQQLAAEQVTAFNDSEREWLVQSAVLEGKLRLHFAGVSPTVLQLWPTMSEVVIQFCELLNLNKTDELLGLVVKIREGKDKLLLKLQEEIDRFTASELELPPPEPAPAVTAEPRP
jgi:hypothetical protein